MHHEMGTNSNFWALPNVLTAQDAALLESYDANFMDAMGDIDDAIDSRETKSKSKSKGRSDRMAVCEKCGAGFSSVGNLNRHIRVSHQGVRVFCDFKGCKQVSTNLRLLGKRIDIAYQSRFAGLASNI